MSSVSVSCCQPPASSIALTAPYSRRAVEIEEDVAAGASGMLQHEMPVEQNGFDLGKKRIVAIDVGPASLHHADFGIGQMVDGPHQKIFRRNKVGVEDGNEFALRRFHAFRQRTRFEAFAIGAMMIGDGKAARSVLLDQALRDGLGFVGRIVKHLNIELLERILQAADRIQQALDDELLVEDGKLYRHSRQIRKVPGRLGGAILSVLVIEIHQHVSVHTVRSQQDEHDEVGDQQRHVKGIGVIETPECGVEKMLANVLADAPRGHESGQQRGEMEATPRESPYPAWLSAKPEKPL